MYISRSASPGVCESPWQAAQAGVALLSKPPDPETLAATRIQANVRRCYALREVDERRMKRIEVVSQRVIVAESPATHASLGSVMISEGRRDNVSSIFWRKTSSRL